MIVIGNTSRVSAKTYWRLTAGMLVNFQPIFQGRSLSEIHNALLLASTPVI
jgi:hypothetical protein